MVSNWIYSSFGTSEHLFRILIILLNFFFSKLRCSLKQKKMVCYLTFYISQRALVLFFSKPKCGLFWEAFLNLIRKIVHLYSKTFILKKPKTVFYDNLLPSKILKSTLQERYAPQKKYYFASNQFKWMMVKNLHLQNYNNSLDNHHIRTECMCWFFVINSYDFGQKFSITLLLRLHQMGAPTTFWWNEA